MPIYTFVLAGWASWFAPTPRFPSAAHVCAMNVVPVATRIEIVNTSNGDASSCTIVGTGPFVPGRVLDVSPAVRDELGMDGLARVQIYRIVGYLPHCKLEPRPQTCTSPPPRLCLLHLPRPALLRCGR